MGSCHLSHCWQTCLSMWMPAGGISFLKLKKTWKNPTFFIVSLLISEEHQNNIPLFMNSSIKFLLALKVLTQEWVANKYSLLPDYFSSRFVGGMAWQCLECKYSTPNCQISPLCRKMNFPSLDGAAPFSDSVWFPVNCICSVYGVLKFKPEWK